MRGSFWVAAVTPFVVLQISGCAKTVAKAEGPKTGAPRQVELTIYSQDFAMVHETRPIQLQPGPQKVQLTDVSRQLDPRSVLLAWATAEDLPAPTSNSYDLGVNDSAALMKRYLGQEVELVRYNQNGNEAERETGRLMVSGSGETVIQTGDHFLINPPGTIVAPAQTDVVTIPQLSVQVESPSARSEPMDVSYLTRGLSWNADYVAELLPSDDAIELQCWATVTNKTGATYPGAKVVLMAGEPNRAARMAKTRSIEADLGADAVLGESQMGYADGHYPIEQRAKLETIGDLQSYKVDKAADIVQDQMNRLLMFSSKRVPIKRQYTARMPDLNPYGWGWNPNEVRGTVQMAFSFFNKEKDGLGVPLPAGALRIYGADASNSKRYLGAADVWNAPKDAKVNVTLSNAFDLYTMRKPVSAKRVNKRTTRRTMEIEVHNAKAAPVEVTLVQPIYSSKWKIVNENEKHSAADAYSATWNVKVPAASKKTLTFSVDTTG